MCVFRPDRGTLRRQRLTRAQVARPCWHSRPLPCRSASPLAIDLEWKDPRGAPLAEPYRKTFRVGPADRTPIDVAKWRLAAPHVGTREPLVLAFGEPLDYAMLQHAIGAGGPRGNRVGRASDLDVFEKVTRTIAKDTVSLKFRAR